MMFTKTKKMKNILAVLLIILSLNSFAQNKAPEWHTDVDKAINLSIESGKPVFFFFTGSDWCGWCKKLVREVFDKNEFSNWASENVVLLDIDFPKRKQQEEKIRQQNRKLQKMFQVQGYPTIWIVMPEKEEGGNINFLKLGKTGYIAGGPIKWINAANQILKQPAK